MSLQLFALKKEWRLLPQMSKSGSGSQEGSGAEGACADGVDGNEDPDIAKIKKVGAAPRVDKSC